MRVNLVIHIPAGHNRDYLVFKYDKNGNFRWAISYNGPDPNNPSDEASALAVDDTGNVYVTGRSDTTSGQTQYLTIKIDSSGMVKWMRRYAFGGSGSSGEDIAIDKLGNVYVTGQTGANFTTIKYSNDGTFQWERVIPGISFLPFQPLVQVDTSNNIYVKSGAFTSSSGTYLVRKYNPNGDTLWTFTRPQPWTDGEYAYDMYLDKKNNIYLTGIGNDPGPGGQNIFTAKISQIPTAIHNISNIIPEKFNLSQNYPNPFNPTTKIKFSVPRNSKHIKLSVFDLLGREVALLVNESLTPGEYEYDFDALHLSSGVYYYRMTSDNFSDTKKMILIK